MAAQYQVNIRLSAGVGFQQEYHLSNPDRSPMDITGCKFNANISKHMTSQDVTRSTSTIPVFSFIPFKARVVDGPNGVFAISMDAYLTSKLQEGKYVYDVVMTDINGERLNAVSGLAFVDVALGANTSEYVWDGGGAILGEGGILFDGGTASDI